MSRLIVAIIISTIMNIITGLSINEIYGDGAFHSLMNTDGSKFMDGMIFISGMICGAIIWNKK